MRVLFLIALLLSGGVLAQGNTGQSTTGISRGNGLRIPQYRTSGTATTVSYFVDPTGNDSNACTASGTSACLTIQAALNKIPKLLRNQVTVNVAAGTYTAGFIISDFMVDNGIQQTTGGLLIDGALANSTLATGSATGTAAGAGQVAGSGSTFGVLCDSGATWTVNDLRGRFITTAAPANTAFVVSSNTATCATIVGTWTIPVAGVTTYTIQDPSVIITGTSTLPANPLAVSVANRAAVQILSNQVFFREDSMVLRNMRIANSTGVGVETSDGSSITFVNMQIRPTAVTNGVAVDTLTLTPVPRMAFSKTDVAMASTTGSAVIMQTGIFRSQNSLFRNIAGGGTAGVTLGNATAGSGGPQARAQIISASESLGFGNGFNFVAAQVAGVQGSRITCNDATGIGILVGNTTATILGMASQAVIGSSTGVNIATCGTGVQVTGSGSTAEVIALTGAAGTTGFAGSMGGMFSWAKAGVTLTAGTNEINLDAGGATSTFAGVTAGTCISTVGFGSRACGR